MSANRRQPLEAAYFAAFTTDEAALCADSPEDACADVTAPTMA